MATLYLEEYTGISGSQTDGSPQAAIQPSVATQTVAIAGSSTQSNPFNSKTNLVRITSDAVCSYLFGSNPTATATTPRLGIGVAEYFSVRPSDKVAVITNT